MGKWKQRWQVTWTWTRRIFLAAVALAGVVLAASVFQAAYRWSRSSEMFRLREVEYRGAKHFPVEAFNAVLLRTVGRNLLYADLERVRALLEAEPWVKEAYVRRRLPDRLTVVIVEREPVAVATVDGELYVVDAEGVLLDRFGGNYAFLEGPVVTGLESPARSGAREANARRLQAYLALVRDFEQADPELLRKVSEVDVADPRRVGIILADDPVPIYLGSGEFFAHFERFRRFRAIYEELKSQYGVVEYVDVSLEDKVIVHTPELAAARPGS
ncbi:MAG: FtsQ-type POTRA domain-containing protein [Acidobacteriota bacterium]